MKTLLAIGLSLFLTQAYAQMGAGVSGSAGSLSGSTTSGLRTDSPAGTINNNANLNQPTTGNIRGSSSINNTNTTTDTIGTGQSSTTRRVLPNTPGTVTPANSNATGVNCVDRSGRNYGSSDTGYTACVNSMRMR